MRTAWTGMLASLLLAVAQAPAQLESVDAGANAAAVPPPVGKLYALCVGWNTYPKARHLYDPLNFASRDAAELRELLEREYGFEAELLPEEMASKDALLERIAAYATRVGPEDAFLFYLAGHGESVREKKGDVPGAVAGFVITPDADLDAEYEKALAAEVESRRQKREEFYAKNPDARGKKDPEGWDRAWDDDPSAIEASTLERVKTTDVYGAHCIRTSDLRKEILKVPARHVIVVFDSCFSGFAITDSRGSRTAPSSDESPFAQYTLLRSGSQFVMTAGTAGEKVLEHKPGGPCEHGVFTCALIERLSNQQGAVTMSRLFSGVRQDVLDVLRNEGEGRRMTPMLRPFGDAGGEYVFVRRPDDTWRASVAKAITGDKQGRRLEVIARGEKDRIERDRQRRKDESSLDLLVAVVHAGRIDSGKEQAGSMSKRWIPWFGRVSERAATADPEGMASMYYAYAYGLGVEANPEEAYRWALDARDTDDATGAAVLSFALDKGTAGNQDELVAKTLAERAQAQEQFAAGSVILAVGASEGEDEAAVLGFGAALAAMVEAGTNTSDKAMASAILREREVRTLMGQDASTERDKALSYAIGSWMKCVDDMKRYASSHARQNTFKRLGPAVCARLYTRLTKLQPIAARGGPQATALLEESHEFMDQLYGLYALTSRASAGK